MTTLEELKNYSMERTATGTPCKFMLFFNYCNNNCIHCFARDKTQIPYDKSAAKSLIDKYDTKLVFLTGGEPTVHFDLKEIVSYCKAKDKVVCLMTNARRLSDLTFLDELIALGIDGIVVPFHSHLKDVHNFITGTDSFDETIKGIQNCIERKLSVQLMLIASKLNYMELDQTAEFMCSLNPTLITVEALIFAGKTIDNLGSTSMSLTELSPYIEKAFDAFKASGIPFYSNSLPLCLFKEEYWSHFRNSRENIIITNFKFKEQTELVTSGLSLAGKCSACALKEKCPGTWDTYYEIFGDSELKLFE